MSRYYVNTGLRQHETTIDGDRRSVWVNSRSSPVHVESSGEGRYLVLIDGQMVRAVAVANSLSYQLLVNGKRCTIEVNSEREMLMKRFGGTSETRGCQSDIIAPMPALVVKINVAVGDHVRNGQGIVVLEAMKMENEIRCPSDGIVQEVLVVTGQAVEKGELLVRLG